MSSETSARPPAKTPFVNAHDTTVPAFGILQITGRVLADGVEFLTCTRPTTSLATEYAVNGPVPVAPGSKGVCHRTGDVRVAYTGAAPNVGEGWGPRAGEWTAALGHPAIITAHGPHHLPASVLFGCLHPLASVIGKPFTDIAAAVGGTPGTATVTVWTLAGTTLSASDPEMTFTGVNFGPLPIPAGRLTHFDLVDGRWIARSHADVCHGKADSHIPANTVGLVKLWTYTGSEAATAQVVSAMNWSNSDLSPGDKVDVFFDDASDRWYIIPLGAGKSLVRFQLTDTLSVGVDPTGDNAVQVTWHDGAYHADGAELRVFDFTGRRWSGLAGYQGWAIRSDDSERHEIVWMEERARMISFRLYQRLRETDASATQCTVLDYWDGRDPDPTAAGITVFNLPTDYAGLYRFTAEANSVGFATWDPRNGNGAGSGGYRIVDIELDGAADLVLYKNTSTYTVPANGVVAITGITRDANGHTQSRNLYTIERATTTLRRGFVVNSYAAVPDGAVGVGRLATHRPAEALRASGTPAHGEGWGVQPNTFTLSKGWPGFVADGFNSDHSLAVVRQESIVQLLGKTTASVASASSTTSYKIYTGTTGSETDSGLTPPSAYNRTGKPIDANCWVVLRWINNGWELAPLVPGGPRLFKALLNGALHRADSIAAIDTVTSISADTAPSPTSAANYLGWAGNDNDACLILEDTSSTPSYILLAVKWDVIGAVKNVFDANPELKQTKQDLIGKANSAAADTTIINTDDECP